ncbi:uncharacterized protein RHO25_000758 [Cercospora beticola]|uniref:Uncharacterized protein n=1 Tax=Cercospora beticola TaxID=122368 RepID=A0ABZ0N9F9_CERBT|nr:hypothetical protein RHO25_000758 [Cercospora beticola]
MLEGGHGALSRTFDSVQDIIFAMIGAQKWHQEYQVQPQVVRKWGLGSVEELDSGSRARARNLIRHTLLNSMSVRIQAALTRIASLGGLRV